MTTNEVSEHEVKGPVSPDTTFIGYVFLGLVLLMATYFAMRLFFLSEKYQLEQIYNIQNEQQTK